MLIGSRDVPLLHDAVLCAHTACLSCTLVKVEQQLVALILRVEALEERGEKCGRHRVSASM